MSDGELLTLLLNPESLTDSARCSLDAELARRKIGKEVAASHRAEAVRFRARKERWGKVRRLRFRKSFFYGILWPSGVLLVFLALMVGAGFLQESIWRANGSRGNTPVVPICTGVLLLAAGGYVAFSGRADRWFQWWMRGRSRVPPEPSSRRERFHTHYCAARSIGSAGFFLELSLLMLFYAYRDLAKPIPAGRGPILTLLGLLYCTWLLAYTFLAFTCLRERIVLGVWILDNAVMVVRDTLPAVEAPFAQGVREFSLLLWVSAALVSLSLFRSAVHAPPPGVARLQ